MIVAEKLRELRDRAGLTQIGLAERSGMTLGAIRNYEQGLRMPTLAAAAKLAAALGTDCRVFSECDDVVGGDRPAPKRSRKSK